MKRKITSVLLALIMVLSMVPMMAVTAWAEVVPDTSWYTAPAAGVDGSAENPYIISDTADLEGLAKLVNEGITFEDKTVSLSSRFSDRTPLTTPIGRSGVFKGTFDGNGKTVKLNINNDIGGNIGLFGIIEDGTVKNVTVSGTILSNGCVGGIVGYSTRGTVENCTAKNCTLTEIVANETRAGAMGGIVGWSINGTVKDCSARSVKVSRSKGGDNGVGGIVGTFSIRPLRDGGTVIDPGSAEIINCYATDCSVESYDESGCGGILGYINDGCQEEGHTSTVRIIGCDFEGDVTNNCKAGGILGSFEFAGVTSIEDCHVKGDITSRSRTAGGIVGGGSGGITIKNCSYSEGTVRGKGYDIGGIAGIASNVTNCYVTGDVVSVYSSDLYDVGGIVGSGWAANCYMTGTVTATETDTNRVYCIGGIVGSGGAMNCYMAGTVTVTSEAPESISYVGGVVGGDKNGGAVIVLDCYYKKSASYNGIGGEDGNPEDVAGSTTALSESQMTASAGETNGTGWVDITVKPYDGSKYNSTKLTRPAMVDALNACAMSEEGTGSDFAEWTTKFYKNDGYPIFAGDDDDTHSWLIDAILTLLAGKVSHTAFIGVRLLTLPVRLAVLGGLMKIIL